MPGETAGWGERGWRLRRGGRRSSSRRASPSLSVAGSRGGPPLPRAPPPRRPPPAPRERPRPAALSVAWSKDGGERREGAGGLRQLLEGRHAALSAAAAARATLRLLAGRRERPRCAPLPPPLRPLPLSSPRAAPAPAANELPARRPAPAADGLAARRRIPLLPPPRRPFHTARALPSSSTGQRPQDPRVGAPRAPRAPAAEGGGGAGVATARSGAGATRQGVVVGACEWRGRSSGRRPAGKEEQRARRREEEGGGGAGINSSAVDCK